MRKPMGDYVRMSQTTRDRMRELARVRSQEENRRVAFCELAENALREYLDRWESAEAEKRLETA